MFITMEEIHVKAANVPACFFFCGVGATKMSVCQNQEQKINTGTTNSRYFCRSFRKLF
jgi:hypothetical protein